MSWLVFGESFIELSTRGLANLIISCVVMIPLCWLALQFVDGPAQRLRGQIKAADLRPG
jgi:peptidoglycan/LPS O-acetylase OafA/YrhL